MVHHQHTTYAKLPSCINDEDSPPGPSSIARRPVPQLTHNIPDNHTVKCPKTTSSTAFNEKRLFRRKGHAHLAVNEGTRGLEPVQPDTHVKCLPSPAVHSYGAWSCRTRHLVLRSKNWATCMQRTGWWAANCAPGGNIDKPTHTHTHTHRKKKNAPCPQAGRLRYENCPGA